MKRLHNDKTIIIFALIIIIAGGVATLFQLHPWAKGPIDIILPEETSPISDTTKIYVDGCVMRPGWYPVDKDSTINDVILSSGGLIDGADTSEIKFYVPTQGETNESQKVSINHADDWLLDALPGIGPTSAQKIIVICACLFLSLLLFPWRVPVGCPAVFLGATWGVGSAWRPVAAAPETMTFGENYLLLHSKLQEDTACGYSLSRGTNNNIIFLIV